MANVKIRNLPDEVHRAIRIQTAQHGHSIEAEIQSMPARESMPEGRVKLGAFLATVARNVGGLNDEEHAMFEIVRIKSLAREMDFE